MFNKKNIITIISIAIIISASSYYIFKKKHKKDSPSFLTEKPLRKDLVQYVNSSGTLKAKKQITIGSLEAGKVVKILSDNNDPVKENQVLAILDNGIGDSNVKKLEAALIEAKAIAEYQNKFFARQKQLYESNQISKNLYEQYTKDLEIATAKVKQTEAQLQVEKNFYNNLFIKSPRDGIIIAKEIDLGQMITARLQATVLFIIAKDLTKMEASVDVDEADVGLVKEGQEAFFTVDAFPKQKFYAKVEQIRYLAKIVDNVVTYATIINVANKDLRLRPGMTTDVNIKVAECKNGLVVHNKALRINSTLLENLAKKLEYNFERIPDTDANTEIDHVWIVKNNTFKQVEIKTGVREGAFTEIIGEIDDNSDILTELTNIKRDSDFLNQFFAGAGGGIGKK